MITFQMKDYNLQIDDSVWGLLPFKAILKKDKSRNKETAFKEVLFIYHYCDIRSDYVYLTDEEERMKEIIKDIGLPTDWKIDKVVQDAIKFYEHHSVTPIERLYKSALISLDHISEYLRNTRELLNERTNNGGTVTTLQTITASHKSLPEIIRNLKTTYKEVLQEQKELQGRTKGKQTLGLFEDGLDI